MNYYINPASLSAVFTVPACVADRHLKLANGDHLKVLLYIMRNMASDNTPEEISSALDIPVYDVNEALLYWADAGILLPKDSSPAVAKEKKKAVSRVEKPGRGDVARRGAEDPKIRYLLSETQLKLGRNLKSNETSTLVWLYDDEGLDVSVILMIVQYASAHNRANIRFIETTAVDWINRGIDSIAAADEELRRMAVGEKAWGTVASAFGLERRKPSKKETELSMLWVDEWKLSKEMLAAAYEACIDSKSKFSMPYIAKILENWHAKGYKTPADIEQKPKKTQENNYGAYDIELFEKMLNTKD